MVNNSQRSTMKYFRTSEGVFSADTTKDVIGKGTYGIVYRAHKTTDKKYVKAVKTFAPETIDENEGIPSTTLREISALKTTNHPNVMTVDEVVTPNNCVKDMFVVMELCKGTLKDKLLDMIDRHLKHDTRYANNPTDMTLPVSYVQEAKLVIWQILNAICVCHSRGIMHRDIKPQNIMWSFEDMVKVGDFGLARFMRGCDLYGDTVAPLTGEVQTLWYRAPEVLLGEERYSEDIDDWSIGCIMAEFFRFQVNRNVKRLEPQPLFAGKGDLHTLLMIFETLGTPHGDADFAKYPYWTDDYPVWKHGTLDKRVPYLDEVGLGLLSSLLQLNPKNRTCSRYLLRHEWFNDVRSIIRARFAPWYLGREDSFLRYLSCVRLPPAKPINQNMKNEPQGEQIQDDKENVQNGSSQGSKVSKYLKPIENVSSTDVTIIESKNSLQTMKRTTRQTAQIESQKTVFETQKSIFDAQQIGKVSDFKRFPEDQDSIAKNVDALMNPSNQESEISRIGAESQVEVKGKSRRRAKAAAGYSNTKEELKPVTKPGALASRYDEDGDVSMQSSESVDVSMRSHFSSNLNISMRSNMAKDDNDENVCNSNEINLSRKTKRTHIKKMRGDGDDGDLNSCSKSSRYRSRSPNRAAGVSRPNIVNRYGYVAENDTLDVEIGMTSEGLNDAYRCMSRNGGDRQMNTSNSFSSLNLMQKAYSNDSTLASNISQKDAEIKHQNPTNNQRYFKKCVPTSNLSKKTVLSPTAVDNRTLRCLRRQSKTGALNNKLTNRTVAKAAVTRPFSYNQKTRNMDISTSLASEALGANSCEQETVGQSEVSHLHRNGTLGFRQVTGQSLFMQPRNTAANNTGLTSRHGVKSALSANPVSKDDCSMSGPTSTSMSKKVTSRRTSRGRGGIRTTRAVRSKK